MTSTNTTEAGRRDGSGVEQGVRPYPLKIENCSGEDASTLMSRGHHATKEFMAAARAYWGERLRGFDGPYQMWWRTVPDRSGDYKCRFIEATPGARGAFPVTAITQW